MRTAFLLAILCATTAIPSMGADSAFVHYRGVTLGDSLETVSHRLQVSPADIRTVQEQPTAVREFTWRPASRFGSAAGLEPDSRAGMLLTFHLNRLVCIAVTYDRDRTRGMTDADLREALSNAYGTAMLMSRPMAGMIGSAAAIGTIGRWGDSETLVLLSRVPHSEQVTLTITALGADRRLQVALADGVRLEATEAPMREGARRVVEAALLQAQEQIARTNKATFRP